MFFSKDHFIRVVFNEGSHGYIYFTQKCRHYTLMMQLPAGRGPCGVCFTYLLTYLGRGTTPYANIEYSIEYYSQGITLKAVICGDGLI